MENKLAYAIKQIWNARCCMASCMEWQEKADWLRLFLFKNISQRQLHECIQQTLFVSIPWCQLNFVVHTLNTDCLAASNGICTIQLWLLLSEMKSIITHGHAQLSTQQAWLLFIPRDSASTVSYACERIWITIMVFAIRLSHYQYYYTSLLKFAILFIYISYSWYDNSLWLLWEWALTYSTPAVSRIILFFFNCSFDWSQLYFFYLCL